jgi:ABC-type lipoprotein release transport system permease subunit
MGFRSPGLAGVSPNDPLAIVIAAGVLVAASFVAVLSPAVRAARTSPAPVFRA